MLLKKLKFVLGQVENIVGKGENAGYQHFLLFPQCFQKLSVFRVVEGQDCVPVAHLLAQRCQRGSTQNFLFTNSLIHLFNDPTN